MEELVAYIYIVVAVGIWIGGQIAAARSKDSSDTDKFGEANARCERVGVREVQDQDFQGR